MSGTYRLGMVSGGLWREQKDVGGGPPVAGAGLSFPAVRWVRLLGAGPAGGQRPPCPGGWGRPLFPPGPPGAPAQAGARRRRPPGVKR